MLELSNQKFKTNTMTNMLRTLMDKVDNSMQEQMSKVSREMKILGTTKKGTTAEMKNTFDVITS